VGKDVMMPWRMEAEGAQLIAIRFRESLRRLEELVPCPGSTSCGGRWIAYSGFVKQVLVVIDAKGRIVEREAPPAPSHVEPGRDAFVEVTGVNALIAGY